LKEKESFDQLRAHALSALRARLYYVNLKVGTTKSIDESTVSSKQSIYLLKTVKHVRLGAVTDVKV